MLWLAAQVFFLCLVSFLAGAGITVLALRQNLQPQGKEPHTAEPAVEEIPAGDPSGEMARAEEIPVDETPAETEELQQEPMVIKASKKSMRYHTPDSPYYNRVSASLTFISPQEAELAGYTAWNADKVTAPTP